MSSSGGSVQGSSALEVRPVARSRSARPGFGRDAVAGSPLTGRLGGQCETHKRSFLRRPSGGVSISARARPQPVARIRVSEGARATVSEATPMRVPRLTGQPRSNDARRCGRRTDNRSGFCTDPPHRPTRRVCRDPQLIGPQATRSPCRSRPRWGQAQHSARGTVVKRQLGRWTREVGAAETWVARCAAIPRQRRAGWRRPGARQARGRARRGRGAATCGAGRAPGAAAAPPPPTGDRRRGHGWPASPSTARPATRWPRVRRGTAAVRSAGLLVQACSRRIGGPMIPPLYEPQLALSGVPAGPLAGWVVEPKLDGFRLPNRDQRPPSEPASRPGRASRGVEVRGNRRPGSGDDRLGVGPVDPSAPPLPTRVTKIASVSRQITHTSASQVAVPSTAGPACRPHVYPSRGDSRGTAGR